MADDNLFLVYTSENQDEGSGTIMGMIFDEYGSTVRSEFMINGATQQSLN